MIIQSRLGQELLQMNGWSVAGGPVQHRCEIGTERAALENFRVRMKKKGIKRVYWRGSNDRTVPSDKHLRREWRMSVKRVLYPCPCCGDDVAAMYVSPHAQGLHHSSSLGLCSRTKAMHPMLR